MSGFETFVSVPFVMEPSIASPARCKIRSAIPFLHTEGNSAAGIHRRLCRVYGDGVMNNGWCNNGEVGLSLRREWVSCALEMDMDGFHKWPTSLWRKLTKLFEQGADPRYYSSVRTSPSFPAQVCFALWQRTWVIASRPTVQAGCRSDWLRSTKLGGGVRIVLPFALWRRGRIIPWQICERRWFWIGFC